MSEQHVVQLQLPNDPNLKKFRLPKAVDRRLQELLDGQDQGLKLTAAERAEAEQLVNLAELLSLLKLRVRRAAGRGRTR